MRFQRIFASPRARHSLFRGVRAYLRRHGVSLRWLHGLRTFYRLRMLVAIRSPKPIVSFVRRREARLYVDGRAAFDRILDCIDMAHHTIIVHMFIWMDDATGKSVAARIVDAADRGVRVQVFKDAVGDLFEMDHDFLATQLSDDALWKRFWTHPQISVVTQPESNHAKAFVIDDEVLLLGGMNISDQYRFHWHDFLVELRGRRFVEEYLGGATALLSPSSSKVSLVVNGPHRRQVRGAIEGMLRSARRTVVLEHAYLSDPRIIQLLSDLSHRGVSVHVVLSEHGEIHRSANMVAMNSLLSKGDRDHIRWYMYPGVLHGKLALVDGSRACIGSANLMTSSLDAMGELNVLLSGRHTKVLQQIREVVRRDIFISKWMQRFPRLRFIHRILALFGL